MGTSKTDCPGNVTRLRFALFYWTDNRGVLNRITANVNHTTICFNKVFTQGDPTTITEMTTMNIRSGFTPNRTEISLKTAGRGLAHKISRRTDTNVKLSQRITGSQRRRVLPRINLSFFLRNNFINSITSNDNILNER